MSDNSKRHWYDRIPRDFAGFLGWSLFTGVWLVLQGLGYIETFFRRHSSED